VLGSRRHEKAIPPPAGASTIVPVVARVFETSALEWSRFADKFQIDFVPKGLEAKRFCPEGTTGLSPGF